MNVTDAGMMSWALKSYTAKLPEDLVGEEVGVQFLDFDANWTSHLTYAFTDEELDGFDIQFPSLDSPIREKVMQIVLQMYGMQTGSSMIYVCQTRNQRSRTKAIYNGPKRLFMTSRGFLNWVWNANPSDKWSWDDARASYSKYQEINDEAIRSEMESPQFKSQLNALQGGIDLLIMDEQWITPSVCSPGDTLVPFDNLAEDALLLDPTGTDIDAIKYCQVIDELGECRLVTDMIYNKLHAGRLDHSRWRRK